MTKFHEKPNFFPKNVTLDVINLELMTSFYTHTLGFSILTQNNEQVELTTNHKDALITLKQLAQPEAKTAPTTGLFHVAILLPQRSDLANILLYLDKTNILLGASDHEVSEALYFNDPEGNGIEIYIDKPESQWQRNGKLVNMVTEPLNAQDLITTATGAWSGMPEGTIIGHVHLMVDDVEKAADFYVNVLGFDITAKYGRQARFLSTGGYHHHLGMNTWQSAGASPKTAQQPGLASYTLDIADKATADALITKLQATNNTVVPYDNGFSTIDPAGNTIHFTY